MMIMQQKHSNCFSYYGEKLLGDILSVIVDRRTIIVMDFFIRELFITRIRLDVFLSLQYVL